MVRVVDGWTFDLHASTKHPGQSAVQLTTPDGSTKYLPKGQIPRAAAAHYRNFSSAELRRRVDEGLHVTVCPQQALDPLMKRLLATPGSNVQLEDHYAALPPLGPGAGKTIGDMTDAELKGFVMQGQEEINRREVNHAVARGVLETERVQSEQREAIARKGEELKRQAEALEEQKAAFAERCTKQQRLLDLRAEHVTEREASLAKDCGSLMAKYKALPAELEATTTTTA